MRKLLVAMLLLALVGAVVPTGAGAIPAVLVVDGDGQGSPGNCGSSETTGTFTTIQEAVTAAAPGSTVRVCPGVYVEDVEVAKTLELLGAQAGVDARGRAGGPTESVVTNPECNPEGCIAVAGITVTAPDVVIDGFTFDTIGDGAGGVHLNTGATGQRVRNNVFTGVPGQTIGIGIDYPGDSSFSMIRHNSFLAGHIGIYGAELGNAAVSDNSFQDFDIGMAVFNMSGVTITRNTFSNVGPFAEAGVALQLAGSGIDILDNTIVGAAVGVQIVSGGHQGILIERNFVDTAVWGVLFQAFQEPDRSVFVRYNDFDGAVQAVEFEGGSVTGLVRVNFNDFAGTVNGIVNSNSGGGGVERAIIIDNSVTWVNGARNYWGAKNGPRGWAPGNGAAVSQNVQFFPWSRNAGFTRLASCDNERSGGDDLIAGTDGNDILCGGAGRDEISGGAGHDLIIGGSGGDALSGGDGVDALLGSHGDDLLFGNAGFDSLQGMNGADNCDVGGDSGQISTCELSPI